MFTSTNGPHRSAAGHALRRDKPRRAGGALTHHTNHQARSYRALPGDVRRAWITPLREDVTGRSRDARLPIRPAPSAGTAPTRARRAFLAGLAGFGAGGFPPRV